MNSESPTRAEVSDITNAIMDNADALMLSEETAIGKYPLDAVRTLEQISNYVEGKVKSFSGPEEYAGNRVTFSISKAARVISDEVGANVIIVLTRTGNTARMVSSVRPSSRIIAVVRDRTVAGFTTVLRGVYPVILNQDFPSNPKLSAIITYIKDLGLISVGQRVVITSGIPGLVFGGTTEVKVLTVGDIIGRGFGNGKNIDGVISITPDYSGEIILVKDNIDTEKLEGKKAIVFTDSIKRDVEFKLRQAGITYVLGTVFFKETKGGEKINIDVETGILYA
ncbi:pyruvate kinase [mine drainage metagenome]|uniref:pyruvate kinase n=1 Tax=mine drainage metagenome TaxID=410659 RepID=T0YD48_9ZZZZ